MPKLKSIKYTITVPPKLNEDLNLLVAESGKPTAEKYILGLIRDARRGRKAKVVENED